jgi:putative transposase
MVGDELGAHPEAAQHRPQRVLRGDEQPGRFAATASRRPRCSTHYAANLMAVTPKSMWPAMKAMLHSVYDQPDAPAVNAQFNCLIDYAAEKLPAVAEHLADAREDLLAFTGFPKDVGCRSAPTTPSSGSTRRSGAAPTR